MRAILDGRKTQTRRIIKEVNPHTTEYLPVDVDERFPAATQRERDSIRERYWETRGPVCLDKPDAKVVHYQYFTCPYGKLGDHLWVKETFRPTGLFASHKPRDTKACGWFSYQADPVQLDRDKVIKWRPSIFMPRWASRITLEITNVRTERLQDINEADALAEGVAIDRGSAYHVAGHEGKWAHSTARGCFETLWGSINGTDSWRSNPWVWVITFKRIGGAR